MADETTETPKKTTRKADPLTQLLNEVKGEIKELGEFELAEINDSLRRGHDRRATAWAKEYGKSGRYDACILSAAFEALSCYPHERRHALLQLAAVAVAAAEKLEAGK
ncbi:hypothetical protein KGG72_gp36 [Streptomyces phage Salutena]|uniref:Uncharacterized protein n=1 Tax=Streptomyces phage Salutena TaxID=2767576 RepID=A0A7S6U327_9CAUD|nr:hypothetical protein KGG72_gp36 [Streptomyces phage Salutena]QOV06166.1 hypothetical protein CPT_Salutena_036 [Streptomyces phage Salutena]